MSEENFESKYVVYNSKTDGEVIIVFPYGLKHSTFRDFNCVRAGFISFEEGKAKCYGDSFTLGLKSDEKLDSELANDDIFNL